MGRCWWRRSDAPNPLPLAGEDRPALGGSGEGGLARFVRWKAPSSGLRPPSPAKGGRRDTFRKLRIIQLQSVSSAATAHATASFPMPLELRPNCEYCDIDLPPNSTQAMICTYECTFCRDCVENHLLNVCPNCGGGFCPRPIRPATAWRPGLSRTHQPPSGKRMYLSYSFENIAAHSAKIKDIPPQDR